ncbi:MAG: QueT transporter family protein [Oscillospiraceae bacterium]|jgi:uncharacterized membrane protein|nr:QueT transporter family protein [Oscillospiraceae bacterium]
MLDIRKIAAAGVVGALYAALTIALGSFGYGPIKLRVAEALCILPFFFPFTVWGLFVGCIAANLISPYPLDIIVGPVATLIAALCTMKIGKTGSGSIPAKALACLPPVVFNSIFIGALIAYYMVAEVETESFLTAFVSGALTVGAGEIIVMYAIGLPLMIYFSKSHFFEKLSGQWR